MRTNLVFLGSSEKKMIKAIGVEVLCGYALLRNAAIAEAAVGAQGVHWGCVRPPHWSALFKVRCTVEFQPPRRLFIGLNKGFSLLLLNHELFFFVISPNGPRKR